MEFHNLSDDTLDSALDRLLRSALRNYSPSHLEALRSRLGWSGKDPITLQQAGSLANITRERVRQIETRVKRTARMHQPLVVDRMMDVLPNYEPELWSQVSSRLRNRGITEENWTLKAVQSVLDQCGVRDWTFVEGTRDSLVGRRDNLYLTRMNEVVGIARRACRGSGAVSLDYVSESLPLPVPNEILRNILHCSEDIEHLIDDHYWVPKTPAKRVRIQNVSKKMLAINRPLPIETIHQGLERKYSFRNKTGSTKYEGIVPPNNVLIALFNMYPKFTVEGNMIDYIGDLDQRQELTRPEGAIVKAFEHYGKSSLDRQTIKEFGDDHGINMSSLEVEMTYSPIVVQVVQNVWTLVGNSALREDIQSVLSGSRKKGFRRRLIEKGRLPNGEFRIIFQLPRFIHNFVASVPSEIGGKDLEATFETADGVTLHCKNGAIFGFGKFLSKVDITEGNYLTIDLNLEYRRFEWVVSFDRPKSIDVFQFSRDDWGSLSDRI